MSDALTHLLVETSAFIIAAIAGWATLRTKVEEVERRITQVETSQTSNATSLAQLNVLMQVTISKLETIHANVEKLQDALYTSKLQNKGK